MRIFERSFRLWRILPLFLLSATFASDSSRAYPLQIKVLSAEFHSVGNPTPVPKDCDMQNFSAYCNDSRNPTVQNVMVVREPDGQSLTIACTVDSRWSKCAPLPVGETFDARKDKNGLTVLYRNAKGKETKQVYQVVAATPGAQAVRPPDSSPRSPADADQAPALPATAGPASPAAVGTVRCRFASTPAGAEITLDGSYVGSTPSVIDVSTGKHAVEFSLPGFGRWRRDLIVIAGSELTISAILQKQEQP